MNGHGSTDRRFKLIGWASAAALFAGCSLTVPAEEDVFGPGNAGGKGGTAGSVPIHDAAAGVMDALQEARPDATWVLLGWQNNPKIEILDAVRQHVGTTA